jgi:YfiH family protein
MHQVHGTRVVEARPGEARQDCDALVTDQPDVVLMVRVADCVPVLLADLDAGVLGAAHAGRPGMVAGVVPRTVAAMRELGAGQLRAWLGPSVCGRCYEVPAAMRAEVAAVEPASASTTSWGTPALDVAAGVRAQLLRDGVEVSEVSRCTLESPELYSYRRDGDRSGRLAGLIRRHP